MHRFRLMNLYVVLVALVAACAIAGAVWLRAAPQ
jgi:hypothetical protein